MEDNRSRAPTSVVHEVCLTFRYLQRTLKHGYEGEAWVLKHCAKPNQMDLWALLRLKPCILRLCFEKLSHKDRFLKSNNMNDWIIYRISFQYSYLQAHLAFCRYVWVDLLTEDICFGGAHLELFGGQHFHLLHFRNLPASYPSSYISIFPQLKEDEATVGVADFSLSLHKRSLWGDDPLFMLSQVS